MTSMDDSRGGSASETRSRSGLVNIRGHQSVAHSVHLLLLRNATKDGSGDDGFARNQPGAAQKRPCGEDAYQGRFALVEIGRRKSNNGHAQHHAHRSSWRFGREFSGRVDCTPFAQDALPSREVFRFGEPSAESEKGEDRNATRSNSC